MERLHTRDRIESFFDGHNKILSGVGSGVGGRSLKLAVAGGRTYGAETRKRTPRLWSDFVPGIVLRGRPGQA